MYERIGLNQREFDRLDHAEQCRLLAYEIVREAEESSGRWSVASGQ